MIIIIGAIMTLLETAISTSEADESVMVCVELLAGDLEIDVTVFLSTSDGTAESKAVHLQTGLHLLSLFFLGIQDYIAVVREPLLFSAGSPVGQRECTDITLINDETVETSSEHFTVELQSDDPVSFVESAGLINIQDNDCKYHAREHIIFSVFYSQIYCISSCSLHVTEKDTMRS